MSRLERIAEWIPLLPLLTFIAFLAVSVLLALFCILPGMLLPRRLSRPVVDWAVETMDDFGRWAANT